MFGNPDETLALVFEILHQTRETEFHRDIQTPRRELKIRREAECFYEIRGVSTADKTLSRVFDISSQTKQKLSTRRSKIFEIYANIKTGYPNLLHGCDCLCFNLMNC